MLTALRFFALLMLATLAAGQLDRVLPGELHNLHFVRNQMAIRHRSESVPQMKLVRLFCFSKKGCDKHYAEPSSIVCVKNGGTLNNPSWECSATLSENLGLYDVYISCEHYDSDEDPYILNNSCAIEYALFFTKTGEDDYVPIEYGFIYEHVHRPTAEGSNVPEEKIVDASGAEDKPARP